MFGFKIVREAPKKLKEYDIPVVKFNIKDYNSKREAYLYNDLMFFEGAISRKEYQANDQKIRNTRGVKKYIAW